MPRVDADRNLLLGILAQQMDFVSRDALFAAMNAWIIRKETPLGALLVERGDLAKSRHALLEALVDEHVRAHGSDPARSLQALSSVGSVAEDLGQLPDTDLRASIGYLSTRQTIAPSADPLETRAPTSLGEPTSWNGRFRVVRPHASGGLGIVSVALDDELDREVAFKEIKDRHADDGGRRARFVLEAEITGKLEHPGIIPVYGLGHDPTGRPFYAMRFVRGDSLAEAINRFHDPAGPHADPVKKSLQLRELLGRFLDVCDALAYAHSRGVLHRDLKPGNIMLGPFGETLVVDWGLALPLDRVPEGHDSTQGPVKSTKADSASLPREHGQAVGTPAYMSPEQAEGALEKLGPRSDVYGLGAILYDLLTGKHPVEGTSLEEVLRHVGRGEIRPPRQVRPEIPAALEAVCLKALALRPEDRYATPRALAADVKAWLADEPVSARREPFAERARRWAKRNRTAVAAVVASLLVGLVGLGVVAAVQTRARAELALKNGKLVEANAALDKQRLRAEDREAQAIAAVKKFGDVISNEPELKKTPALEGLRKRLLNEPLAFFRALRGRLQADRDTRPESLNRLAVASYKLGVLSNEIGDIQDAMAAFGESLAIFRRLAQAEPSVTAYHVGVADCHDFIGVLLRDTGRPAEAMESHRAALAIREKLAEANPSVSDFQRGVADCRFNIAYLLRETGRLAEAMAAFGELLAIREKLAEANPSVSDFQQRGVADCRFSIACLLGATGRPAEALAAFEESLAIYRRLAEAEPSVAYLKRALADCHINSGGLLRDTGRPAEALAAFEESLAISRRLAEANPSVSDFQRGSATCYMHVGGLLRDTGRPAEALAAFEESLAIYRRLAQANPSVSAYQGGSATCHNNIGLLLGETGRPAEAMESHRAALAIREKLAEANPSVSDFQRGVADCRFNIAYLLRETGRLAEAMAAFGELLAIREKLAEANPSVSDFQRGVADCRFNIAYLLGATGRPAEALAAFEESLAIYRRLAEAEPSVAYLKRALADCHINSGGLLRDTGRPAEALAAFEESLAISRRLAEANPSVSDFQRGSATCYMHVGGLLRDTGRPAEALAAFEESLAIYRRLAQANPSVSAYQGGSATCHNNIGLLLGETGRPAEAMTAFGESLAIREKLAEAEPSVTAYQASVAESHNNIGLLLGETGRPAEALKAHEAALAIQQKLTREHPESPDFASALGGNLNNLASLDLDAERFAEARVRLREAVAWQRKALASNPRNPTYRRFLANHWVNLTQAARGLADSGGVAEAGRELTKLRDSDPATIALDARLAAVLRSDQQARDNPERLHLARRAYEKTFHAAAAKLWADVLDADPKLAEDRQAQVRYNAACAALLAGCGRGRDQPSPDDATRAKLRGQALAWLRAERAAWTKLVESGPPEARPVIAQTLQHWKEDSDLAGVREAKALDALPEAERDPWRALWAGVDALLARAREAPAPAKKE